MCFLKNLVTNFDQKKQVFKFKIVIIFLFNINDMMMKIGDIKENDGETYNSTQQ